MKSIRSLSLAVLLTALLSASCGKGSVDTSSPSTTSALTANSSSFNAAARRFGRHNLTAGGAQVLFEFIRPEVRARLDEEPVGDADSGYDPSATDPSSGSDLSQGDSSPEGQAEEPQQATGTEESHSGPARLESKFAWAKKSFGDAVKADIRTNGVIVLYADENYYDTGRLMEFVEQGRNMIVDRSGIGGERIQVVYGGYRGVAQVEYWVVPQDGPMPEFKPEGRSRSTEPED